MSAESSPRMSLGQKIRLGAVLLLAAYVVSLVGFNWTPVDIAYFPFVSKTTFRLPVILFLAFAAGAVSSYLFLQFRALKKKAAPPPATLPPAGPSLTKPAGPTGQQ